MEREDGEDQRKSVTRKLLKFCKHRTVTRTKLKRIQGIENLACNFAGQNTHRYLTVMNDPRIIR